MLFKDVDEYFSYVVRCFAAVGIEMSESVAQAAIGASAIGYEHYLRARDSGEEVVIEASGRRCDGASVVGGRLVVDVPDTEAWRDTSGSVRIAGDDASKVKTSGVGAVGTEDFVSPVGAGVGLGAGPAKGVLPRGPNYERNRENRERKRIAKKERRAQGIMSSDWRSAKAQVAGEYRSGYFSKCPPDVQDELRSSRAKMLIAKNKKDMIEYEKRSKQLNSSEEVVRAVLSTIRLGEQLRAVKDEKVGGWAETVADSVVKSAVESVPSSIPSLESVGYGKSAFKSSSGSESGASIERRVEYEIRMKDLESYYDDLGAYSAEDYDNDVKRLKTTYADVTGVSASLKTSDLIAGCLKKGMSYADSIALAEELGMCEFE